MTSRVAIYAAPGTGTADPDAQALRARAESWLGRAVDGTTPDTTLPQGWSRDAVDAITVSARRYGFHGTLKAPFRLAAGTSMDQLDRDVRDFAAATDAVTVPDLTCGLLGDFFALIPGSDALDLHQLADDVVTCFDSFRAPATQSEIDRRAPELLSPRRRELLEAWGYPLVLDEFRFHLTVTDRIPTEHQPAVQTALKSWFAESLGRTITIDTVALFVEPRPGAPFRLHSVHPLRPLHSADPLRPPHSRPESHRATGTDREGTR